MYEVVIKGFGTLAEAKEFYYWYEGQGEQMISDWMECRVQEGTIQNSSFNTNMDVPMQVIDHKVVFEITPSE